MTLEDPETTIERLYHAMYGNLPEDGTVLTKTPSDLQPRRKAGQVALE
jgi:hypothetical protein